MKLHISLAILCLSLFTVPAALQAEEDIRIATVDVNRLINSLDEAKKQKAHFEKERTEAQKNIEQKQSELQKLESSLREKKVDPASEEGTRFRVKIKEFERYVKDKEEELKRDFFQANQKLGKVVFDAIEKYAKSHQIDLVLEKSRAQGGPVLFGTGKADITDEVLATLK